MSPADTARSRIASDFYPTPAWCVRRLAEALALPAGRWCCRAAPMTARSPISREQRDGEWRVSPATAIA